MNENNSFIKKWQIDNNIFTCYFHIDGEMWNCIIRHEINTKQKIYHFCEVSKKHAIISCKNLIKNHLRL